MQETELEWILLPAKELREDRLVWALNVNYELEYEEADEGGYERDGMFECSPDSLTALSAIGQRFGILESSRIRRCHRPRAFSLLRRTEYSLCGERWWATLGFLIRYQSGRHSVRTTRSLARTTVTSLAMSTKNITCGFG